MGDIINSTADLFGLGPASKLADATTQAAQTSANAQLAAAKAAQQAAQFRPVGITNTFGTSNFQFDPTTGYLSGANYQLSPELKAYQDFVMNQTRQGLGDVTAAQNLGRQYLAQSPQQAAQQYMTNQQSLLQPSRDMESARLANQLQQTGRTGVSVAQGGMLGMANPEQQALANARALQDLQLAAQAQQAGQQNTQFGLGLLSSAYSPLTTGLGVAGNLENLGQNALTLGANLGGQALQGGATGANALFQGGTNAANTLFKANSLSPTASAMSGFAKSPYGTAADQAIINWGKGVWGDWTAPQNSGGYTDLQF